jgi:hypothetical protein
MRNKANNNANKNYNPNYPNVSEFTNNTNHKNSKLSSVGGSLPAGRQGRQAPPAEKLKAQNCNSKLKSE